MFRWFGLFRLLDCSVPVMFEKELRWLGHQHCLDQQAKIDSVLNDSTNVQSFFVTPVDSSLPPEVPVVFPKAAEGFKADGCPERSLIMLSCFA